MEEVNKTNPEHSTPRRTTTADGRDVLVVGVAQYEIEADDTIDLDGLDIPSVKMDQLPEHVFFMLYYRYMLITIPHFFGLAGNAGICVHDDAGSPFLGQRPDPFMEFWKKSGFFAGEDVEPSLGIHFALLNMPGDTLDVMLEDAKKMIDTFWDEHRAALEHIEQTM